MNYQCTEAVSFWDCVDSLRRDDRHKGQLVDTLSDLRSDPFRDRLRTHKIGTALNGRDMFASDVGGRGSDRRVVWQFVNRTIVVLLYGTHKIYDRARRMRVAYDPGQHQVTVYERGADAEPEQPYQYQRASVGRLFMAWTDEELESFGFPPAMVACLRSLNTDDELLELTDELGDYCDTALNLVAYGCPDGPEPGTVRPDVYNATGPGPETAQPETYNATEPGAIGASDADSESGSRAVLPASSADTAATDAELEDAELEACLADDRSGRWFTRTEPEFLAEIIKRPIEDWMIFLHPEQRSVVRQEYNGPARVRGPAGTGKTVIGLHRAAWLARRGRVGGRNHSGPLFTQTQLLADPGTRPTDPHTSPTDPRAGLPVLFTTHIKSLLPVLESLYLRLPGTRDGEVEFVNIDKLARGICRQADDEPDIVAHEIDAAYSEACKRVITRGSPLERSGLTPEYLRDEITKVIKGRAVDTLDRYLEIRRTGRRVPLRRAQRTQTWELMQTWDAEMAGRSTVDFCDVITRALGHARKLDAPLYSAVIADETQDLTLTGLMLLRALVNAPDPDTDCPNGLLILGDAAQRVYPGGFKLHQAGVEVRGRTTLLKHNYRNTEEIMGAALAVAGGSRIDDLDEQFRRGDARASALRSGPKPRLIQATGIDAQMKEIIRMIGELTGSGTGYGLGDMAVLTPANGQANSVCKRFKQHGIAYQKLDRYDGTSNSSVKVGTYFRGKGLEFKVVFLPQVTSNVFPKPRRKHEPEEEYAERCDLELSRLFVAMTRARDLLIVLHDGKPSEAISAADERFFQGAS